MTSPSTTTIFKDPQKEQAILDCATGEFAKVGFQDAEMQTIAEKAAVGKGTVYRYFGSKEELFLATADAAMKKLERHMFAAIEGIEDPIEVIRLGALAYAEFFQNNPQSVEIFILERAEFRGSIPDTHLVYRAKNRGILDNILRQGIAGGSFREVDIQEVANAFGNLLYGTVVCGCLEGSTAKLKQMAAAAADVFLHGILRQSVPLNEEN